jgi:hypothetical protein
MEEFTAEDMTPQTQDDFEFRKDCLPEELKDLGIPKPLWEDLLDAAEAIQTDKGLDDLLNRTYENLIK